MKIQVECPSCLHIYDLKPDLAGKRFRCKQCQEVVAVPRAKETESEDDDEDLFEARRAQAAGKSATRKSAGRKAGRRRSREPWIRFGDLPTTYIVSAIAAIVLVGVFIYMAMQSLEAAGMIIIACGALMVAAGGLKILGMAFEEDTACGLMYLFVPLYKYYYILSRFEHTHMPMGLVVLGLIVVSGPVLYQYHLQRPPLRQEQVQKRGDPMSPPDPVAESPPSEVATAPEAGGQLRMAAEDSPLRNPVRPVESRRPEKPREVPQEDRPPGTAITDGTGLKPGDCVHADWQEGWVSSTVLEIFPNAAKVHLHQRNSDQILNWARLRKPEPQAVAAMESERDEIQAAVSRQKRLEKEAFDALGTPVTPSTKLKVGDSLLAQWNGGWVPVKVLSLSNTGARVHFENVAVPDSLMPRVNLIVPALPRTPPPKPANGDPPKPPAVVRPKTGMLTATTDVRVGEQFEAQWGSQWLPVTVLQVNSRSKLLKIHWVGDSDAWDQFIRRDQLRYPEPKSSR